MLHLAAYSRILSPWFSVEYCWCSVDIRTYCAALKAGSDPGGFGGGSIVRIDPSLYVWWSRAFHSFNEREVARWRLRTRSELLPYRKFENAFGIEVTFRWRLCRSSHLLTRPSCTDRPRTAA